MTQLDFSRVAVKVKPQSDERNVLNLSVIVPDCQAQQQLWTVPINHLRDCAGAVFPRM